MGDVYGVNRTLKRKGTVNTIEPELQGGVVKWLYDEFVASALASNSVIKLFGKDLPAEARIVDWIIDADSFDCHQVEFGDSGSWARFMAAKDMTSATKSNFLNDAVAGTLGYEIVAGSGQTLVLHTSGGSTADGTIRVAVAYVTKG